MGFFSTSSKITPQELAIQLHQLIFGERAINLISTIRPLTAASKLIGQERLLEEINCLLFFAVSTGITGGASEKFKQRESVREAFIERLRNGSPLLVDKITKHFGEYQKTFSDSPDDLDRLGWRFVKFCGIKNNFALEMAGTFVFCTIAKEATALVEKYEIAV
ncbi:MAG: hypothetical protein ACXW53_17600 [Candidatus Binatia bacterium]